jgi:hypothetical protein
MCATSGGGPHQAAHGEALNDSAAIAAARAVKPHRAVAVGDREVIRPAYRAAGETVVAKPLAADRNR